MSEIIKLLNDEPLGDKENDRNDGLGFSTYSKIIANTIKGTPGPFTIGIFGEWGTGKTSLLRLIKKELDSDYNIIPVWFNAWMYEKEEHPLLPLISTIITTMHKENNLFWRNAGEKKEKFFKALRAVAYGFSSKSKLQIPGFAEIEASFIAKDMIDREAKLVSDPLLDKAIYYNAFDRLSSVKLSQKKKIVIFIDDLDRCFPDHAIKLLESIKLIFSQKGFIFVLGVARQVIEGYLRYRYQEEYGLDEFEGQKYLDKIVQLAFPIPPHTQRIEELSKVLLHQLGPNDKKVLAPILPIIGAACAYNPRATVRFINNLLIDKAISKALYPEKGSDPIEIGYFVITRGLQLRWIDVFDALLSYDELCKKLAECNEIDQLGFNLHEDFRENSSVLEKILEDKDLQKLLFSDAGRKWLKNSELRNFAINFLRTQRQQAESTIPPNYTSRIRVHELAKEFNVSSKEMVKRIKDMGFPVRNYMSSLTKDEAEEIRKKLKLTIRETPTINKDIVKKKSDE